MPHDDTSLAIQQAIIKQDTTPLALNATQGPKPSYQQAIYINPKRKRRSNIVIQGFNPLKMTHKDTSLAINKL